MSVKLGAYYVPDTKVRALCRVVIKLLPVHKVKVTTYQLEHWHATHPPPHHHHHRLSFNFAIVTCLDFFAIVTDLSIAIMTCC